MRTCVARPFPNATDSRLNVGAGDWTIECWLRLDATATDEGSVIRDWEPGRGVKTSL